VKLNPPLPEKPDEPWLSLTEMPLFYLKPLVIVPHSRKDERIIFSSRSWLSRFAA